MNILIPVPNVIMFNLFENGFADNSFGNYKFNKFDIWWIYYQY